MVQNLAGKEKGTGREEKMIHKIADNLRLPKAVLIDLDDTITTFDLTSAPAWRESTEWFVKTYEPAFSVDGLIEKIQETKKWYWSDPDRHKRGRENLVLARREVVMEALQRYAGERYFANPNWELVSKEREETAPDVIVNEKYRAEERAGHAEEYAALYMKLHNERIRPMDGAVEALDVMKESGLRLAVVTNGIADTQREKIERFGLTERFEHIFIDTEIGYSKPDPRIFEYALNKMQLRPEEVWMIGDNIRWDVGGPQAVGITGVWINSKQVVLPANYEIVPDLHCDSLLEVAEVIRKMLPV